jgi:hypothetical protein
MPWLNSHSRAIVVSCICNAFVGVFFSLFSFAGRPACHISFSHRLNGSASRHNRVFSSASRHSRVFSSQVVNFVTVVFLIFLV